jgi:hypothetical protein
MSRSGAGRSSGVVARCGREGSAEVRESFLIADEGDGATIEAASGGGVKNRILG